MDYLKCVVANKFTLAGYMLFIFSLIPFTLGILLENKTLVNMGAPSSFIGFFLLVITLFGIETLMIYHRTKKHIAKHGTRGLHLMRCTYYCGRVGIQLAAKEAGAEGKHF